MPVAAPPDHRVAYDIDGTRVFYRANSGAITTMTGTQKEQMNRNSGLDVFTRGSATEAGRMIWLFDQPMTIAGLWATFDRGGAGIGSTVNAGGWGYSTDTTNGIDGTWTFLGTEALALDSCSWAVHGTQHTDTVEDAVRDQPYVFGSPVDDIVGLRIYMHAGNTNEITFRQAAIYGHVTNPLWLTFWHPTLDQAAEVADVDWGFHDRFTVDVLEFRLKNCHPTAGLSGISLELDDISTDSPAAGTDHRLSDDGVSYSTTISIPDLGPGDISDVLYVRRNTPSNAVFGIYEVRIKPTVTSFF
jgi:hypothetical protein